MSSKQSVEELLSNLEEWAAFHKEKEAFHGEQEIHHREQRAFHEEELGKVLQRLEAFRTTAEAAIEIARPLAPRPALAAVPEPVLPSPGRLMVSRLLRLVVESPGLEEPFTPTALAEEANRRFAGRLKEPIASRSASDVLRRMTAEGKLRSLNKGKAFHETMYERV
ncbi:MAG TPA: hypothetical protein VKK31_27935 [Thermoanaerobaculia bacterium]|nr:hypothetical protein [Thermoanaerobaculia bacterium]